MDTLPSDILALVMTSYLSAIDRRRMIRSRKRWYVTPLYFSIYKKVEMYRLEHFAGFTNACRDAEDHFIDLHVRKSAATKHQAAVECARNGNTRLVQKYLEKTRGDYVAEFVINLAIASENETMAEIVLSCYTEAGRLSAIIDSVGASIRPSPKNRSIVRKGRYTEYVVKNTLKDKINPYVAAYFFPEYAADFIDERTITVFDKIEYAALARDGPYLHFLLRTVSDADLRATVFLSAENWLEELALRAASIIIKSDAPSSIIDEILSFPYFVENRRKLYKMACGTIYSPRMLERAIEECRYLFDNQTPHTTFDSYIHCMLFKVIDSRYYADALLAVARQYQHDKVVLEILMCVSLSLFVPEMVLYLKERGVPIPDFQRLARERDPIDPDVLDLFYVEACSMRYIHPSILPYLAEANVDNRTIVLLCEDREQNHLLQFHNLACNFTI